MTEQLCDPLELAGCPTSSLLSESGKQPHAPDSAEVKSPGAGRAARLVLASADGELRILIGGDAITGGAGRAFAAAFLRLADQATLIPRGDDLVITLAHGQVTLVELAVAAGLGVERLRDQHAGGQVLCDHDLHRLAFAAARLISEREDQAGEPAESLVVV